MKRIDKKIDSIIHLSKTTYRVGSSLIFLLIKSLLILLIKKIRVIDIGIK